jgi:hypothetical protein
MIIVQFNLLFPGHFFLATESPCMACQKFVLNHGFEVATSTILHCTTGAHYKPLVDHVIVASSPLAHHPLHIAPSTAAPQLGLLLAL